ncbi:hypothetical protein [Nisaea sediminum]|uniref:hypothetical protein n=1 Tax=Nisaea sediminum TaxID=2775867 RepID=UPI001865C770|nr:hypothetical protein [Nisaea sediminum]
MTTLPFALILIFFLGLGITCYRLMQMEKDPGRSTGGEFGSGSEGGFFDFDGDGGGDGGGE